MNSLIPPQTSSNGDSILDLTIRFSASLPDLLLSIALPPNNNTGEPNTSTLKQAIRTHLPEDYANRRIRLIYAGKALADNVPLSVSLKRPLSRPPSRPATPLQGPYDDSSSPSARLKGKQAVRDPPLASTAIAGAGAGSTTARIYIHCSIGDVVLSPVELATEASLAQPSSQHGSNNDGTGRQGGGNNDGEGAAGDITINIPSDHANTAGTPSNTGPAPRGFDRLIAAGFTSDEVRSLRLQFLDIQAHTHTPDTMPDPAALRDLEDRWLDNSNALSGGTAGLDGMGSGGGGAGGSFVDDDFQAGSLDDIIFGATMGFFWPIGCLMWAIREEGIWSERRRMAVVVGVLMNVALGIVRFAK